MRRLLLCLSLLGWFLIPWSADAATGKVIKVLPHFLDSEGRHTLAPSLYERDAYQAELRKFPEKRAGIRFDVQWKSKGTVWEDLKLKVELRGIAQGDLPRKLVLEQPVEKTGWFSRWSSLSLVGDEYKNFGEVTAWRVTLWEGKTLLAEEKSFLW